MYAQVSSSGGSLILPSSGSGPMSRFLSLQAVEPRLPLLFLGDLILLDLLLNLSLLLLLDDLDLLSVASLLDLDLGLVDDLILLRLLNLTGQILSSAEDELLVLLLRRGGGGGGISSSIHHATIFSLE